MKKLIELSQIMRSINTHKAKGKSLGVVAAVAAFSVFGLVAGVAVIGALAFFQLAANTSIALDINQLFSGAQTWLAELVGIGQGALEDLQRFIESAPSEAAS